MELMYLIPDSRETDAGTEFAESRLYPLAVTQYGLAIDRILLRASPTNLPAEDTLMGFLGVLDVLQDVGPRHLYRCWQSIGYRTTRYARTFAESAEDLMALSVAGLIREHFDLLNFVRDCLANEAND